MLDHFPTTLMRYVPAGHALRFNAGRDLEATKPPAIRNVNAQGGLNRQPWIVCDCGTGMRLQRTADDLDVPPTPEEWLEALNRCRLAVHSARRPCPPVTMEGDELPVREAPTTVTVASTAQPPEESKDRTRKPERPPKKEMSHAA